MNIHTQHTTVVVVFFCPLVLDDQRKKRFVRCNDINIHTLNTAAMVNFGPLVWMYSIHAEVFALNNLFVALLLYLVVRYVQVIHVKLCVCMCIYML
jgi:hypothetical protein